MKGKLTIRPEDDVKGQQESHARDSHGETDQRKMGWILVAALPEAIEQRLRFFQEGKQTSTQFE